MSPEELFTAALGLGNQWKVSQCRFEGEPKTLELRIESQKGARFQCPDCGEACGIHDSQERRWRHLNFFQYRTELVTRVPRIFCRKDGVKQIEVPWAREGSGFTLMMEALVMLLARQMPLAAVAEHLEEHDSRLWRIVIHYVQGAQALSNWSWVREIAVDETSARRGHRYVTSVIDAETSSLLFMCQGRSSEALQQFASSLKAHQGDPAQIQAIAMDMSPAYIKGAKQYFPNAQIVFDKFHLMQLAGKAVDELRRQLLADGASDLKGSLWSLRGNVWNLSTQRQARRKDLCCRYTALGRAMSLKDALQSVYTAKDRQQAEQQLHWWYSWACRSRLPSFRALAKTIRNHWNGILAHFDTHLTSGAIEAINGILQLAKRSARGFKNFLYFQTVAYLRAAHLDIAIPTPS